MTSNNKKVLIVGSGVFGLSSALHLAKRGYTDITVFDRLDLYSLQFSFENGADTASADINKVFRAYYADKDYYHRLALRAKQHFKEWDAVLRNTSEEEAKQTYNIDAPLKIIDETGLIRLDNTEQLPQDEIHNLESFTKSGLRNTQYDINDVHDLERAVKDGVHDKIDAFRKSSRPFINKTSGVLDGTSGLIYANNALLYVYHELLQKGVKFITGGEKGTLNSLLEDENHNVKGIRTEDGLNHYADITILATGPWTASIVPELAGLSEAHTGNVVLIKIPDERIDLIKKYSEIPILNWRVGENKEQEKFSGFGIFPITNGYVKLITRQRKYDNPVRLPNGEIVSIPLTTRSSPPESRLAKSLVSLVKDFIRVFLPDLVEFGIAKTQLLWYTDTINNDFIVDYLPSKQNLLVVTGGSGHGFKFLPVLGQYVVDRIEGNITEENEEYLNQFKWRDPEDYNDINKIGEVKLGTNSFYKQDLATQEDLKFSKEDLSRDIEID